MLKILSLETDQQIMAILPVMQELRERIAPGSFLREVRLQQQQGYKLAAGFLEERPVVVAGYRFSHTLARGPHVFVDDLVTTQSEQGKGFGRAMLRWLAAEAAAHQIPMLYLDSRASALSLYQQLGFELLGSVPCRINVNMLMEN